MTGGGGSGGADCNSLDNGKKWCYVNTGACEDGQSSSGLDADWSYMACSGNYILTLNTQ